MMVCRAVICALHQYDEKEAWEPLPLAHELAKGLASQFEGHGISVEHKELIQGGDNAKLGSTLDTWFRKGAQKNDVLILYWTGHGHRDRELYLVSRNSPPDGLSDANAVSAETIGKLVSHSNSNKILVVLDTCYSGAGADDLARAFAAKVGLRTFSPDQQRTVAVIASAHALEQANEGDFGAAFQKVLFDPQADRLWSDADKYIHSEFLARAISNSVQHSGISPQYKCCEPRLVPHLNGESVNVGDGYEEVTIFGRADHRNPG
jgi:hypothetical protein